MHRRTHGLIAAASILSLACSSGAPPRTGVTLAPGAGVATTISEATRVALVTADSAARAFAPADVEFMQGMVPHHAQAIRMAGWAETHGARADVKLLSARILVAQTDEIRMMRRWLADRRQEVPDSMAMRHVMTMNGMRHEMMMPGMLTDEEMAALDAARGSAFDRLFLTGMIRHHQGAIEMVYTLLSHGNAGHDDTVFRFANDVVSDQSAEITLMYRMLETVPPLQ
ncbi:MAG: DUF305 domain-containing protein [Gemmatimonadetes bacterium]|nr:DUF305 domain-containing protein [Gemmatimonadota bacterium]